MTETLTARAVAVLDRNRRGSWTCPAAGIYPHQWLWDSSFTAIGLARHDATRAAAECTSLLRGQWSNGMLPHMIFAADVRDIGSERLWRSRLDPRAPEGVNTSCITQPPVLAIATRRVAAQLHHAERPAFLATMVPGLAAHHEWLYRERDPQRTGLVTLIHPWECGLDTSPPWMTALRNLEPSTWLKLAMSTRLTRLVRWVRRDTKYIPAAERGSDDDGLRMLDLARRLSRHHFDLVSLEPTKSLLVHDVSFNALLAVANQDLTWLADVAGIALAPELRNRMDATPAALEALWDDGVGMYCARDATTGTLLEPPTVASFSVLWAGTRRDRLDRLVEQLTSESWATPHPVPSIAQDTDAFEPRRYWSGPTWVNTNWIVIQGLLAHGATDHAERLRRSTLAMAERSGFAEYFSALTGEPLGAPEFSWTAALALDLDSDEAGAEASSPS